MKTLRFLSTLQFYLWVGLVWLLLWVFSAYITSDQTFYSQVVNEIWRAFYVTLANLVFFEFGVPIIFRKGKTAFYSVLIGISILSIHIFFLSAGLYGWKFIGEVLQIYTPLRFATLEPDNVYYRIIDEIAYQAQGGISSFIFFGMGRLLYSNIKMRRSMQQLRFEKQEAELNYLKSQTNPHFLFNTLNNIYSLSKDKSDLAPESIVRLSKILRFMLYETNVKFIRIGQEVEIINNYIELEKLRYDSSLQVQFSMNIKDKGQSIPPLLLIPLVENAFKHGVSETKNNPYVNISLHVDEQHLLFEVKNSFEKLSPDYNFKENIGLSNLRRQLELLYADHHLSVIQRENYFLVTLKINFNTHV